MQFMVITERFSNRFDESEFAAVIPDETQAVRRLYSNGVVRAIWLRGDTRGACFILEAESLSVAESIVATFPLTQKEMSEFRVIPLQPYGGFGPDQPARP
ncbi:hypothetical protein [Nocardia vermiculata]|uniref:Muconolactone isomerase domain-containing protein n=1 Tax=Nocardia vermiculata TaxID=257274 RepID=A0A846XTK8_9NOCA|nr:hypothetical protein [Nocardia vermiculata]NKY48865.1 hypothetical protein [Nocardia vermiculata]